MCVPQQLNSTSHANGAVFSSLKQRLGFGGGVSGGQGQVIMATGPSPSYSRGRGGGSPIGGGGAGSGGSPVTTTGG